MMQFYIPEVKEVIQVRKEERRVGDLRDGEGEEHGGFVGVEKGRSMGDLWGWRRGGA